MDGWSKKKRDPSILSGAQKVIKAQSPLVETLLAGTRNRPDLNQDSSESTIQLNQLVIREL